MPIRITIDLGKTTSTWQLWRTQWESNAAIGEVRIIPDTAAVSDIVALNCVITDIGDMGFDGRAGSGQITLEGTYYVNKALWGG